MKVAYFAESPADQAALSILTGSWNILDLPDNQAGRQSRLRCRGFRMDLQGVEGSSKISRCPAVFLLSFGRRV